MFLSVGRGFAMSISPGLDTPPNSPSVSRMETHRHERTTSTGSSSPSRASSDDDFRLTNSVTYLTGINNNRPALTNVRLNSTIMGNICPRCSKTVYSAEEIKAIGKVNRFDWLSEEKSTFVFSHFTNVVILVQIVKEILMLVDIPNMKEKFTTTVNLFQRISYLFSFLDCYQRLFGPKGIALAK